MDDKSVGAIVCDGRLQNLKILCRRHADGIPVPYKTCRVVSVAALTNVLCHVSQLCRLDCIHAMSHGCKTAQQNAVQ